MTITVHDFTRPPGLAPELRTRLARWLGRSNALLGELFGAMSVTAEFKYEDSSNVLPTESLATWSDKSVGYGTRLEGSDSVSLIALPNPLVQDLIGRLIGDQQTSLPAERELTPTESSVAEFIVETIQKSLNESWQDDHSIELKPGDPEPNLRRSKLFRPSDPIVVCRSTVKTSLGESYWCWMMTIDYLSSLFNLPVRPTKPEGEVSRKKLEQLILEMQTEIEVRLGGVQLTGPQLARLRVGDVVVLDQRVGDPLQASVRGEPKFLGWAGRVGNRQAFEVESVIEPKHQPIPEAA